jgi:hypothetical protein
MDDFSELRNSRTFVKMVFIGRLYFYCKEIKMSKVKPVGGSKRVPVIPPRPGNNLPSKNERQKSGKKRGNAPPRKKKPV